MAGIDAYTKLMLHCDGADESTTFTDSSAEEHSVTAGNDAQIDTAVKKFGTASGKFDGTKDYLVIGDDADWFFDTGDFTIDTWVKTSANAYQTICYQGNDSGTAYAFYLLINITTGYVRFFAHNDPTMVDSTTAVDDGDWHHIAVVREGNTLTLYIDGTSEDTYDVTDYSFVNSTSDLYVGAMPPTANYNGLNGHLDELRISKGIARWTANFTPPTSAYSEDTPSEGRIQINIGDTWKTYARLKINIGDDWKEVNHAKINIGDAWKTIF